MFRSSARAQSPTSNFIADAFRSTRTGFFTAILFSFFINILAFVGPLYMLQIYDRVITSRNTMTLIALTVIAAFLLIVYASLEKIRSAVLVRLGILFATTARTRLFDAVLRGNLLQPGRGHTQALRDLDTIREFLTGSGLISFCDAPWVPIFVVGCFLLHPWYGYIATGGAVLIFCFAIANELLTRKHLKAASTNAVVAGSYAAATFRNAEVLHAMGMLSGLRQRWLQRQDEGLVLQAAASDRAGHLVAASKFTRAFLQVAILGTGAYLSIEQESTPGAMIAASIIMGRALAPVELAVANWKGFVSARSAYDRIKTLLGILPQEAEKMPLPAPEGHLTVENVVAIPPGSKEPVLRGVSFAMRPGEVLGILGPSAAGKSSLARVLVGVWQTSIGKVRVDGAELNHWDPEKLGKHIGYLPQDVELFSGSIAENIARFGNQDEEKIITAARMAGVHDMVQAMPAGYNTQIGEGGFALSGGQRQRVGLARALYGRPAYIILDEPNASLDADGEAALLSAIQQLRQDGSTVVLITHKTNILAIVDKILVLSHGQVAGLGSRDEMLAKLLGPRLAPVPAAAASA
jgi:ATP-binding cassette, subfamily C, type I secretion system permease/ATPase